MYKLGATLAAFVHLLVVLSLVIESEQLPKFLGGGKSEEWLWEKLQSGMLSYDRILESMKKVSGPNKIAIGETNLEKLIQMSSMTRKDCNDATYKEREDVCQKAEASNNKDVIYYCEDRLVKLTWFCADNHYERIFVNPPLHLAEVEYFRSLFNDYGSKILDESEIQDLGLEYVYDADGQKSNKLERYCNVLKSNWRQSGSVRNSSEQPDSNSEGPNWDNAYNLCKFYFGSIGKKFSPSA